jgi:hypothetical protein
MPGMFAGMGVGCGWVAPGTAMGLGAPSYWITWMRPPGSTPSFSVEDPDARIVRLEDDVVGLASADGEGVHRLLQIWPHGFAFGHRG